MILEFWGLRLFWGDFGVLGVFVAAFVNFVDFGVFVAAVNSGHKYYYDNEVKDLC